MKRNFLLSLSANGARVLLGFVLFWQVARTLELSSLGDYFFLLAALGYFGTLIDFGYNLFVLNSVSRHQAMARDVLLRVFSAKAVLTLAASVLLLALFPFVNTKQGIGVTLLLFGVIVLQSFSGVMVQFFKSLGRFEDELSSTLLGSLSPVVLVCALGQSLDLTLLALVLFVTRMLVLALQLCLFVKVTAGQTWKLHELAPRGPILRVLADVRSNYRYALFSLSGAMFLSVDLVMMRYLLGPEEVSVYGTAMKVALAVILFFEVLAGVFVPRLARAHQQDGARFTAERRRFIAVMMVGGFVASACLAALGPALIRVAFSPDLAPAGPLLQVLSLVVLLRIAAEVSGPLLTVSGLQGFRALVMLFMLPLHVLLNVVLQPQLGIWGATAAQVVSYVAWVCLNMFFLYRAQRNEWAA